MHRYCQRHGTVPATGCPHCQAQDRARRNQRVKEYGYSSRNWQTIRKQRHTLAGGYCELRLSEGCTLVATHTHLDPALKGDHAHATLGTTRACCANCSGAIDAPRSTNAKALA